MIDNERAEIEKQLGDLRASLVSLRELPVLSPEFTKWLLRLYRVVDAYFGAQSSEMTQLRGLSPEAPPEFFDSASRRVEDLGLPTDFSEALLKELREAAPEKVFQQRLHH